MSIQEEKEWLRAILEGRVKPGDVEWEKVCLDDDFAGLRKRLHEIDLRALSNRAEDLKAIWRNIEQMREERLALRRRRVVRRLFYGAASMALVVALSAVFLMRREKPVSQVSSLPAELGLYLCCLTGRKGFCPRMTQRFFCRNRGTAFRLIHEL